MERLRLGIAGLGAAARQVLSVIHKAPGVELAAGADIRPEALEEFAGKHGAETFDNVADMCRSDAVDAVWVATPNVLHAEHTVMAAEHGKHVITEKPMAVSLEEADRMVAAAARNGVKLLQGHSKVYDPPVRRMREIVSSGRLGRVVHIQTMNYNDWLQRPRIASEVDTDKGGGLVYRQGPHQTDIVRCLGGGMVRSVRAVTGRWDPNFDTEGNFAAMLEFEDGAVASMSFNGYGYFDVTELTWDIGEGGYRVERQTRGERLAGALDPREKYRLAAKRAQSEDRVHQPFFGLTIVSCERGVIRQSPDGLYVYTQEGREQAPCGPRYGRAAELMELRAALVEERPVFPDGTWGKATLEVCLAMLRSSRERREVRLEHQAPCPF